jgi:hypothetical protein
MKKYIIGLLLFISPQLIGQQIIQDFTHGKGIMRFGDGANDFLRHGLKGYAVVLPGKGEIKGTIISLEDLGFDITDSTQSGMIHQQAYEKGFAFIYVATGVPVDFFFDTGSLSYVDSMLQKVFTKHHIPNKNIFFQGIMTSGHRALKYIEYCKKGKSSFKPDIKGVFLSESAIDWVRQWYEGQKQVRDHLTETAVFEGKLVSYMFNRNLKGTPVNNIEKYLEFSPYSYFDPGVRKVPLFKDIAIRAYTFADTDYWFSAPGKGVYDSNYPDMSGIINEQKLAGNKKAELVVFHKENKTGQHIKQTGTWGMVDKRELLEWIARQID